MTYKVSKDYKRLKQLLDEGNKIVCFIDFDCSRNGDIVTDIACAKCVGSGEYKEYYIYARGIGYFSVYPSWYSDFSADKLYSEFECYNVQFIDPDYQRNNLELECK